MKTNLLMKKLIFLAGILLIVSGVALFILMQNQPNNKNYKNNRIDTKEEVLKLLHEIYSDACDYQYKKTEKGKIIFECNEENYQRMYLFDIEKQNFTTETVVFNG